jgi:DNA repair photolyase
VNPRKPRKGRGAPFDPPCRYDTLQREAVDDGWTPDPQPIAPTRVEVEHPKSVLTRNRSPDVPFDRSVNPYRGCEHGCIYCYARPTHAWLGLSPGLDFETRLTAKPEAAAILRRTLLRPGYACAPIALGTNTDPYQPVERRWRITRGILEVLSELEHPCTITTKGALIERDLDLLASMAARRLVHVQISITTLEPTLARALEPRAAAPRRRLEIVRSLSAAGIPVAVMVAPVVPALTDHELERILEAAAAAGARSAAWILVRLPLEVAPLFEAWLHTHVPERAERVLARIRDTRAGRENDPRFGRRMRGEGVFADLIAQRFRLAVRRLGLEAPLPGLDTTRSRAAPEQLRLL